MPNGVPAGLLALAGSGQLGQVPLGRQPTFQSALTGSLGLLSQAQQGQGQRGDRQFDQMLQIAEMEQQIRQAEAAQAQAAQKRAAKQAYVQGLPPELQALGGFATEELAKQQAQATFQDPTSLMQNAQAAGLQPGTPAFQDFVSRGVFKPQTQVTINQPKLEAGYVARDPTDLSKGVVPQPGGSKDPSNPKNWTGEQRKAANFASRLDRNNAEIEALERQGFNPSTLGGVIARAAGRPVRSAEARAYQDFQDDWVRAILRKESGAAITEQEREAYSTYFPQLGDETADIARKAKIRSDLAQGVAAEAGPAYQPAQEQEAANQAAQQLSPADLGSMSIEQLQELQRSLGGAGNP